MPNLIIKLDIQGTFNVEFDNITQNNGIVLQNATNITTNIDNELIVSIPDGQYTIGSIKVIDSNGAACFDFEQNIGVNCNTGGGGGSIQKICISPVLKAIDYLKFVNGLEAFMFKPSEPASQFYTQIDRVASLIEGKKAGFDYVTIPINPYPWFDTNGNLEVQKLTVMFNHILGLNIGGYNGTSGLDGNGLKYDKIIINWSSWLFLREMFVINEVDNIPITERQHSEHINNGTTFETDTNGTYQGGNQPSLFSDFARTQTLPRVQTLLNFLQTYQNYIIGFDLWLGNTGEFYLAHSNDYNLSPAISGLGDKSEAALNKWRLFVNNKYGANVPNDYQTYCGSTNAFAITHPTFINNPSVGLYMMGDFFKYRGVVGKDYACFYASGLLNHYKWNRNLIKQYFPNVDTAIFTADFMWKQADGFQFNDKAILDLLELAEVHYTSDGYSYNNTNPMTAALYKREKLIPQAVTQGMYGYAKKGAIQFDPPDFGISDVYQNICNTLNQANTVTTDSYGNSMSILDHQVDVAVQFAKRGGHLIYTAMNFPSGVTDGGQTICNSYEVLLKPFIQKVKAKLIQEDVNLPNSCIETPISIDECDGSNTTVRERLDTIFDNQNFYQNPNKTFKIVKNCGC